MEDVYESRHVINYDPNKISLDEMKSLVRTQGIEHICYVNNDNGSMIVSIPYNRRSAKTELEKRSDLGIKVTPKTLD